jgi:hypothetical protein
VPYIKNERREACRNLSAVQDVGDLNYFITLMILRAWADKPSYSTIHMLHKDLVIAPRKSELLRKIWNFDKALKVKINRDDIDAAAAEAFLEFRLRVGKLYEGSKILSNGDLTEYAEAVKKITAEVNELVKTKQASAIIIPNSVEVPKP